MILSPQAIEIVQRASSRISEYGSNDKARMFIVDEVTKALHLRLDLIGARMTQEAEDLIKDLLRRTHIPVPESIYNRSVLIRPPIANVPDDAPAIPCKPGEY